MTSRTLRHPIAAPPAAAEGPPRAPEPQPDSMRWALRPAGARRTVFEEELTVAVLHHLDGYTQDGIADSLDLSRRTVGKILAKFEDHLKKRAARTGFTTKKAANDG